VLGTRAPAGEVWIGLRDSVDPTTYRGWIERQDTDALLDSLNHVPVRPGDVFFVPAGVPHAIGAGLLIAELQEPTDYSVVCEWTGFPIAPGDADLGLGWDEAVAALDLGRHEPVRGLPQEATAFFWADEVLEPAGGPERSAREHPGRASAARCRHRAGEIVRVDALREHDPRDLEDRIDLARAPLDLGRIAAALQRDFALVEIGTDGRKLARRLDDRSFSATIPGAAAFTPSSRSVSSTIPPGGCSSASAARSRPHEGGTSPCATTSSKP